MIAIRQRHKPWAKEKIAQHQQIVIPHPEKQSRAWNDLFGREAPLHVEVGTGKGRFVSEMAKQNPEGNFVGIELAESIIVSALERVIEEEIENVKLIHGNAQDLLQFFKQAEVDTIYLNFSDPWPKNRHEKRRLTHESFLQMYKHILKPDGEIHLKTDNQGLFEYSLYSFSKHGLLLKNISLDLHKSGMEGNVMTEYEEKFSEKGNPIYRCEAVIRNENEK